MPPLPPAHDVVEVERLFHMLQHATPPAPHPTRPKRAGGGRALLPNDSFSEATAEYVPPDVAFAGVARPSPLPQTPQWPLIPSTTAALRRCDELLRRYNSFPRDGPCPRDRHLVEALIFDPACPKPGLRRCQTRVPLGYDASIVPLPAAAAANASRVAAAHANLERRMRRNVAWEQFEPLSSWDEMRYASKHGSLPGKQGPQDGRPWAALAWDPRRELHHEQLLRDNYEGRWGIPLSSGKIRLALDVGGGSGRFAAALRRRYGITCLTTAQDNAPATDGHHFDLPFYEMIAQDGLPAILWSGADRLPMPDLSLDLINAESAVENFSSDPEVFEAILFEWDRLLRPGGFAVVRGFLDGGAHPRFSQCLRRVAALLRWEVVHWPAAFAMGPSPASFGEFVHRKAD